MNEKSKKATKIIILAIITCGLFVLLYQVFYNQLLIDGSDICMHLKAAVAGKGYSLLYRMLGLVYNFLGGNVGVIIFEIIIIFATWLSTAKLVTTLYKGWTFLGAMFVSLPAVFVSAIYVPVFYPHIYTGQIVTQPYHNITYYGMRLFAVMAMIFFAKMFEKYLEKIKFIEWILVAGLLACSTSVKPSFFYGFALTLLIFLIIDFVKTRFKLNPFLKMVIVGLIVVPSIAIMAVQAGILYSKPIESGGSGIAIIWGKSLFTQGFATLFKFACGIGLPCLVAIANFKDLKRYEKFTYVMFVIQFLISIMFDETGKRAGHGNFVWGVYSAGFFLFIITFARFFEDLKNHKNKNKVYLAVGSVLTIAHVASSIYYFAQMVLTGVYSI